MKLWVYFIQSIGIVSRLSGKNNKVIDIIDWYVKGRYLLGQTHVFHVISISQKLKFDNIQDTGNPLEF